MIPRAAVLSDIPDVSEVIARCDGALSDAIDAVHMHSLPLAYAVPMHAGSVESHVIHDGDIDCISPASLNQWTRELAIEHSSIREVETIGIDCVVLCHVQGVVAMNTSWCQVFVLVVCSNIALFPSESVSEPASGNRLRAVGPVRTHGRVVALKFINVRAWRPKDLSRLVSIWEVN